MYRSKVRKIELRFAANDLVNKDLFSLSDPFLVCHTVRDGRHHAEIGRTETVQDDLNPVWATTFSFDYDPTLHAHTILVVDLFDRDSATERSLAKHDFLGRAFFTLSDLLDAPAMHLNLPLKPASTLLPTTSSSSTSSVTDDEAQCGSGSGSGQGQFPRSYNYRFHTKQARQKDIDFELRASDSHDHAFSSDFLLSSHSPSQSTAQPNSHTSGGGIFGKKLTSFHRDKEKDKPLLKTIPKSSSNNSSSGDGASKSGLGLPTPRKTRSRTTMSASASRLSASASSTDLIRATSGSRAERVSGTVDVYAEELRFSKTASWGAFASNTNPNTNPSASGGIQAEPGRILLRVRSASLKVVGGVRGFRSVTQFYELQRERVCGAWNCVYRSGDATYVDRDNYVVFDDVVIDEQTMNNLQGDRKLRLAFYQRHTKRPHTLISYVTTTLSNIRRTTGAANNYQTLSLKMEGLYKDDDGLGNVLVSRIRFGNNHRSDNTGRSPQASGEDNNLHSFQHQQQQHVKTARRQLHDHDHEEDEGGGGDFAASTDPDGVNDVLFNKHAGADCILTEDELLEYRLRTASVTATDGDLRCSASGSTTVTEESRNMALECRADHFLNKKFTSSLNDNSQRFERRLLQKPAFISMH